jgi:S1-C subfamily serine protease
MSGPKHLWSGDWERESEVGRAVTPLRVRGEQPQPPPDEPSRSPSPRRRRGRAQLFAALAIVIVAGAIVGIVAAVGGSSKHPAGTQTAAQATTPHNFNPGGTNQGQATIPQGQATIPQGQATTPQGQSTTPSSSTAPQPSSSPVANEPTVDWLGMQIQDSGSGNPPVIDTVDNTGAGEVAGLEPGDQLVAIDGRQVDSVKAIATAVAKVKVGDPVTLEVNRGSTSLTAEAILSGRPTSAP